MNDKRVITQRDVSDYQHQIDGLQDENMTMKLRIADLEQELVDERYKTKLNYDMTIETVKAQVQE